MGKIWVTGVNSEENGGKKVIGLIAQEVQKVVPEIVKEDPQTGSFILCEISLKFQVFCPLRMQSLFLFSSKLLKNTWENIRMTRQMSKMNLKKFQKNCRELKMASVNFYDYWQCQQIKNQWQTRQLISSCNVLNFHRIFTEISGNSQIFHAQVAYGQPMVHPQVIPYPQVQPYPPSAYPMQYRPPTPVSQVSYPIQV